MKAKSFIWMLVALVLMISLACIVLSAAGTTIGRIDVSTSETDTNESVPDINLTDKINDTNISADIPLQDDNSNTSDNEATEENRTIEIEIDLPQNDNPMRNESKKDKPKTVERKSPIPPAPGGGGGGPAPIRRTQKQEPDSVRSYKAALDIDQDAQVDEQLAKRLEKLQSDDVLNYNHIVQITKNLVQKDDKKDILVEELLEMNQDFVSKLYKKTDKNEYKQELQKQVQQFLKSEDDQEKEITLTEDQVKDIFEKEKDFDDIIAELFN